MRRFKNILAVIDHGKPLDSAIDHALDLARRNDAAITIMETSDRLPEDILLSLEGGGGRRIMEEFEERRRAKLMESAHLWEDLEPTLLFPSGKPFLDIVQRVIDAGHDLVVKAADPPPTGSSRLFGSVDMHLVRKCPGAVWLHKPGEDTQIRRILACIDLSSDDVLRNQLNTAVMEMATSLARDEGSGVDAAYAWWLPYESTLRDGIWLGSERGSVDDLMTSRRIEAEASLKAFVGKFESPDLPITCRFLNGDPRAMLPKLCHTMGYDLIVMGTITKIGLPGYFIGETAETVLGEASVPVLAVKPEGWVSPVAMTAD